MTTGLNIDLWKRVEAEEIFIHVHRTTTSAKDNVTVRHCRIGAIKLRPEPQQ